MAHVESSDEMSDAREALFSKYETQRADIWNLDGPVICAWDVYTQVSPMLHIYININVCEYVRILKPRPQSLKLCTPEKFNDLHDYR